MSAQCKFRVGVPTPAHGGTGTGIKQQIIYTHSNYQYKTKTWFRALLSHPASKQIQPILQLLGTACSKQESTEIK